MPLSISCPACGKTGRVADQFAGHRVKCSGCGKPFIAGGAPGTVSPPIEPPRPRIAPPPPAAILPPPIPPVAHVAPVATPPPVPARRPADEDEAFGDTHGSSYVTANLMPGERVVHTTRLHWIVFVRPIFGVIAFVVLVFVVRAVTPDIIEKRLAATEFPTAENIDQISDIIQWSLLGAAGASFLLLVSKLISFLTSEFAVTNKRVIVKVGFIWRRALDLMLRKIESVHVEQGVFGRLLDYGTLIICGSGGTREPFSTVSAPIEFRNISQGQAERLHGA